MNEMDLKIQTILDLMDSEKRKKHIDDAIVTDAIMDMFVNYVEVISRNWINNKLEISEMDFKIKNILRIMNDRSCVMQMADPDITNGIDDMLRTYAKEISNEIISEKDSSKISNMYIKLSNIDAIYSFNNGSLLRDDDKTMNNIAEICVLYLSLEAFEFKKNKNVNEINRKRR